MTEFTLHPRLASDTTFVADWGLSRVLLMDDARFAWLILVPRRMGAIELHDLGPLDRSLLIEEVARASVALKTATGATKINTGALGNIVPQLHLHVVARNPGDAAWPGPVWGWGSPVTYDPDARDDLLVRLSGRLA
jgi:diadenosine tetraphosphate (Ap4A) HIT family hydrolase